MPVIFIEGGIILSLISRFKDFTNKYKQVNRATKIINSSSTVKTFFTSEKIINNDYDYSEYDLHDFARFLGLKATPYEIHLLRQRFRPIASNLRKRYVNKDENDINDYDVYCNPHNNPFEQINKEINAPIKRNKIYEHDKATTKINRLDADSKTNYDKVDDLNKKREMKYWDSQGNEKVYIAPPYNLLKKPTNTETVSKKWINDMTDLIHNIIYKFKKLGNSKVIGTVVGASITQFEIATSEGVSISDFTRRLDDFIAEIGEQGVRFEYPVQNKRANLGIEIPNPKRAMVRLKQLILSHEYKRDKSLIKLPCGLDKYNKVIIEDAEKMPQSLGAGTSGSGKSRLYNAFLTSLLMEYSPSDINIILCDPKKFEFSHFYGVPHLLFPVATEYDDIKHTLINKLKKEYQRRLKIISKTKARKLSEYRELCEKDRNLEKIPYLLVFIDEYPALVEEKKIDEFIRQISNLGRAVGIHMFLIAQKPTSDVVNGNIKTNCNTRFVLQVDGKTTSNVALTDTNYDASLLKGEGDMFLKSQTHKKIMRLQTPFVDNDEVDGILNFIRKHNEEHNEEIEVLEADEIIEPNTENNKPKHKIQTDNPLFYNIGVWILEDPSKRASFRQVYAHFKELDDYTTKEEIRETIKELEDKEVISKSKKGDSRKRKALMSLQEFKNAMD